MSGTQLTVTLSGGGVDDARVVVRALEGTFGAPDELPGDENATVRMATFDGAAPVRTPQSAGHLSAPVTVGIQGTPEAVRRAREVLAHAFTARDQGAASGDQEQERQLLLVP